MSAAENKALIQNAFEHLSRGDSRPYFDMMADDFTFTIMGGTSWQGEFVGKAACLRDLFGPLTAQFSGPYTCTVGDIVAEGDLVVVEFQGHVMTTRGELYDNRYCMMFRVADGKVRSAREYADTALVEQRLVAPAKAGLPQAAVAG